MNSGLDGDSSESARMMRASTAFSNWSNAGIATIVQFVDLTSAVKMQCYTLTPNEVRFYFVSDTCDDWPFPTGSRDDLPEYTEVTDSMIDLLVEGGFLEDNGREVFFPAEPELYLRRLRNRWMDDEPESDQVREQRSNLSAAIEKQAARFHKGRTPV